MQTYILKKAYRTMLFVFFFLPQQLRVNECDDILQQLVGRADQKVRSEGFDEGPQEGRLAGSSFLIGQQHFYFLGSGGTVSSCDVVGDRWRGLGVHGLGGQILFTVD